MLTVVLDPPSSFVMPVFDMWEGRMVSVGSNRIVFDATAEPRWVPLWCCSAEIKCCLSGPLLDRQAALC